MLCTFVMGTNLTNPFSGSWFSGTGSVKLVFDIDS